MSSVWQRVKDEPQDLRLAVACLLVGWFFSIGGSSTTTVNGQVTSCSYFDFSGTVFGAAAMFFGGRLAFSTRGDSAKYQPALGVLAVLLGVVVLLRGLGVILGPCN